MDEWMEVFEIQIPPIYHAESSCLQEIEIKDPDLVELF